MKKDNFYCIGAESVNFDGCFIGSCDFCKYSGKCDSCHHYYNHYEKCVECIYSSSFYIDNFKTSELTKINDDDLMPF